MLRLIHAKDLHDCWGWVRNGLVDCAKRTGERFLPEDVYHSLRAGASFLFAVEHNGDDIGFVVLQQQRDPDGEALFVFALWTEPGIGWPLRDSVQAALVGKAAEVGARRIRMQSSRKGWNRCRHYRRVAVVYECEVRP